MSEETDKMEHLAVRHDVESVEKFGEIIAVELLAARIHVVNSFVIIKGSEEAQQILNSLVRQLQEIINLLGGTP